ncbi:cyun77 [Cyclophragma undans nucleopolyhedrovirus]|uniref:Cyun77 n=1 Tax=Cyclophragma undans nucleopolyhedrovirus TaxID=1906244 RepID=A0A288QA51_9ABAC|nr:cyun77 [Cyclophragma undans nucleopolyhedrovirus]AOT85465.1 cyun77 [Cyclophragma undans nucleopolyhedrovirus]
MSNIIKTFFSDFVEATTFTHKVRIVKDALNIWLYDIVYKDVLFWSKLKEVMHMFITNKMSKEQIYMLVKTIDTSNKFKPFQIDYLKNAIFNNRFIREIIENFADGKILTDEDIKCAAIFFAQKFDEAYKLPPHYY